MHAHSRFQSFDPFGQRRGSLPAADQKDRSSGNENDACWVQFSLQTLALGRTCLTGCVFTAFFFLTMPLLKSYVTWNNKGGVGKTTLTFHMATQYALTHPLETILVIDLCPQANVSSALLRGMGNVARLTYERKTVSFYLHQVSSSYRFSTVNLRAFLTQVNGLNNQIPPNVYLLCGDIHLETVARSLEQKRNANLADDSSWVFVTSSVRYFIEGHFYNDYAGTSLFKPGVACQPGDNRGWVVFIDTNPSFSVYTEIALLAAQRLIIPVNADDFSREALKSLLHLVYGIAEAELPLEFKLYDHKLTFSYKSKTNGLRLPLIYLLIHNRATRYNLRSAQAFYQLFTSSLDALQCALKSNSECFEQKPLGPLQEPQVNQYLVDLYDFHTDGIVALHYGCPLAALKNHYTPS